MVRFIGWWVWNLCFVSVVFVSYLLLDGRLVVCWCLICYGFWLVYRWLFWVFSFDLLGCVFGVGTWCWIVF